MHTVVAGLRLYGNKSGTSGILAFEISDSAIMIIFHEKLAGKHVAYWYDYEDPGEEHVEEMKRLAMLGKGLASYKNKNVKGHRKRRPLSKSQEKELNYLLLRQ